MTTAGWTVERAIRAHLANTSHYRRAVRAADRGQSFDPPAPPPHGRYSSPPAAGRPSTTQLPPPAPAEASPLPVPAELTDNHLSELLTEATAAHRDGDHLRMDPLEVMSLIALIDRERATHRDELLALGGLLGQHAARETLPPREALIEVLRTEITGLTDAHAQRVATAIARAGIRGGR